MTMGALAASSHVVEAEQNALPTARSLNIPYLIGLDHVRGFAALLIVCFHGVSIFAHHFKGQWHFTTNPVLAVIAEGHTAVALFMVLSGFIFTFGTGERTVDPLQFWRNRFFRTYPLYIFIIITGASFFPAQLRLASAVQMAFGGANLPGSQDFGAVSAVSWSIAAEWQFYLLFPAFMLAVERCGAAWLWRLLGLVIAGRVLAYFAGAPPVRALYGHLLGRLDQFVIGMLAGLAYRSSTHRLRWRFAFIPSVLTVWIGLYAFHRLGGWPVEHWVKVFTPTLEGLGWTAVTCSYLALTESYASAPGLLSRGFAGVGAMSYSIYLWHYTFLRAQEARGWVPHFVQDPMLNAALVVTTTTLPAVLSFSALSYHAIEKPFLALRKHYTKAAPLSSVSAREERSAKGA